MTRTTKTRSTVRSALAMLGACTVGMAHASVSAPALPPDSGGGMTDIAYGSTGNIFELNPFLFVTGLGGIKDPASVTGLNADLDYSFSIANAGTSLMTIDYVVRNHSAVASFSDLRFVVFANPDGEQTQFLDRLSESWGAAAPGDPARREATAFELDPFASIKGRLVANNNLTSAGPSADCAAAAGCDAVIGLQWNAPTLAPGESFVVRLGLSDNGQSLSSRFITASAIDPSGTALTVSGTGFIVAVPEPSSAWMLIGGLGGLGALAARRRRRG